MRPTLTTQSSRSVLSALTWVTLLGALLHIPITQARPVESKPQMNEASLVPESDLKRHALPATQRSFINVALRKDSLTYMDNGDLTSPLFVGLGGPLLSYKNIRWRSFTCWMHSEGFQFESAVSAAFFSKPSPDWYIPIEYTVGVHAGLQALPNYDSYRYESSYSYDGYYQNSSSGVYRSVDPLYYGLQLTANFSRSWVELSFDLSEVRSEEYEFYQSATELSLTRVGLSWGFGFF